jgi:hypothetical protein
MPISVISFFVLDLLADVLNDFICFFHFLCKVRITKTWGHRENRRFEGPTLFTLLNVNLEMSEAQTVRG